MEMQGRLIFHQNDKNIGLLVEKLRRDIVPFPYGMPPYQVIDGITNIVSRKIKIPLKISGDELMQDLNAARLACRQIGISEDQFNHAIADYQIKI
jgi:UDP-N-acetylmuramate: L-alanyl-gamma-D-glutamyl-meso-diaminopimelate ligase